MLSPPPEHATAKCGAASNGANDAISRSNSTAVSDVIEPATAPSIASAAQVALLGGRRAAHIGGHLWEIVIQPRERRAGVGLLAHVAERHGELQQIVRRLAALGIFLIALGEGDGGVFPILAHVKGLAEPVYGIAGEWILRMLRNEGAQRLLGTGVIGPTQQRESGLVLVVRRRGRRVRGRRRSRR